MHMAGGGDAQEGRGDARASCASPLGTPLALANNKQGSTVYSGPQYIQADNLMKRSGVSINRKKYKYIFYNAGPSEKLKTCCDLYCGLHLSVSMHVNKTQSISWPSPFKLFLVTN
jgi:hypothetical protein